MLGFRDLFPDPKPTRTHFRASSESDDKELLQKIEQEVRDTGHCRVFAASCERFGLGR